MPLTLKEMVAAAEAVIPKVSPAEGRRIVAEEDGLIVDVREAPEVTKTGKIKGAVNISRGLIEMTADPSTSYHDPALRPDRPILLYCAAGGRAVLAGKTLSDMGFPRVYSLGRFADWAEEGGEVEPG